GRRTWRRPRPRGRRRPGAIRRTGGAAGHRSRRLDGPPAPARRRESSVGAVRRYAALDRRDHPRADGPAPHEWIGRHAAERAGGGATSIDPVTTYVHAGVQVGPDTVIHPQSYLEGATAVGARCTIGPQARLVDATVGDGVTIVASSVERGAVGEGSTVGPYSRLRPGTRVGRFVEIGNFAELKNAEVGDHTKVHHMSYLGDVTGGVG